MHALTALILLTATAAGAPPGPSGHVVGPPPSAPAAGAPAGTGRTADAPSLPVETYTLDNGLTVLLSRDTRLPVVAVEVRYMVGSAYERKGRTGFAHLFEHLMFQGSKHFDDEYFRPFEPIGARINGTTSNDRTNYYERVPSNYLETVLWMESDRMGYLLGALDQAKLDNQRDVVKNERRQNYEDRPYGVAWGALHAALFPEGHPYHHIPIGSHADLTAATLDDVKGFFRTYYVPANAIVTIVGDFEPTQARDLVERYFGSLPGGARAKAPEAPPVKLTSQRLVVVHDQVKLPRVYLAWPSPAIYAPGDAALGVWSSVLTDGKSSRLYKPLVYDAKVAKDVQSFQYSRRLGGMFIIQATAAPGKTADDVAAALLKALRQAQAKPPTEDELARTLNGWRKSFFERLGGVLARAQMLSNYFHMTGHADYLAQDLARYTSLTSAKIAEAARGTLSTDAYVRLDVLPVAGPKPASGGKNSTRGGAR